MDGLAQQLAKVFFRSLHSFSALQGAVLALPDDFGTHECVAMACTVMDQARSIMVHTSG